MAALKNILISHYNEKVDKYIFSSSRYYFPMSRKHHCGNPRRLDNITYVIYLVNKVVGHN